MKINSYICIVMLFVFASVSANESVQNSAYKCLSMAKNTKVSERDFRKALADLKRMCRTGKQKQYFEEIKEAAEARFNSRPLLAAVVDFSCKDGSLAMSVKPSAISEVLEVSLDESYTKVSRKDIDKAIEELKFPNSDLFDQRASARLGKFIGAQYIICGNIENVSGKVVITAKVIEAQTGKIVKTGLLKLGGTGEILDAIPSLAKQLSVKKKSDNDAVLSVYAVKYLNSANRKLYAENFGDAFSDISHGNMFLAGNIIKNSLISIQTSMTASTSYLAQGDYASSLAELNNSLDMAKSIFGETDDVVIHYYFNMAKYHFQNGNIEKAETALQDAQKRFERTKDGRNGYEVPFASFSEMIKRKINKKNYYFNKRHLEEKNNNFILEKFNMKAPAGRNSAGAVSKAVLNHTAKKQLVHPVVKPVSQVPAETGEIRALLNTLERQSKQKNWGLMQVTSKKIFAKDPGNRKAKEILINYAEQVMKAADKQMTAEDYDGAVKSLTEIKVFLSSSYIRKIAICHEKNGNLQEAAKYYTEAAAMKDVPSLMWMGKYSVTNGNPEEGVKYYETAAGNGAARAYLLLAALHLSKRQGIYNEAKGIHYMKRAAEAGVPAAQYNLGCIYANFPGARYASVPYDRTEAIKWLKKARNNGIKNAEKALSRLE